MIKKDDGDQNRRRTDHPFGDNHHHQQEHKKVGGGEGRACVIVDCGGRKGSWWKPDTGKADSSLDWLERILENVDPKDDVLLCDLRNSPTHQPRSPSALRKYLLGYIERLKGVQLRGPPRRQLASDIFWTFAVSLGACLLLISIDHFLVQPTRFVLMIPSFAVIAALIFDNFTAPLAQPRNIICGNLIGGLISCTIVRIFDTNYVWFTAPLAISTLGSLQMLTGNTHPPGGSIALYILYGPPKVRALGYLYVFLPVLVGSVFFVLAATIILNVFCKRFYPKYWN